MCSVSMIADFYGDKWRTIPQFSYPLGVGLMSPNPVNREEFESLKREVLDMKELLKRAKAYDEKNGQPDCEIDEKMDLLHRVAEMVGINLDDVIKSKGKSND